MAGGRPGDLGQPRHDAPRAALRRHQAPPRAPPRHHPRYLGARSRRLQSLRAGSSVAGRVYQRRARAEDVRAALDLGESRAHEILAVESIEQCPVQVEKGAVYLLLEIERTAITEGVVTEVSPDRARHS